MAFVVALGGAIGGFSLARYIYIAQGDHRVLEITKAKSALQQDFDAYKLSGAERVRGLERDFATQAELAASASAAYKAKAEKAQANYLALLRQRKEVAGQLSSAAVDTINTK